MDKVESYVRQTFGHLPANDIAKVMKALDDYGVRTPEDIEDVEEDILKDLPIKRLDLKRLKGVVKGEASVKAAGMSSQQNYDKQKPDSRSKINIVLLGESGVGKSTWINAMSCYLQYDTFDDAVKANIDLPIPVKITVTDPNTYDERTIVTGKDDIENFDTVGESVTRYPRAYSVDCGKKMFEFIDTPGVADTRGKEVDKTNADNILRFISLYEHIHAICILLRPDQERLTENFAYCISQVLHNLHDSARNNVVFCFTNSKSTNYAPGSSVQLLNKCFDEHEKLRCIKPSPQRCFFMDNEPVKLLVKSMRMKLNDAEEKVARDCWHHSKEASELFFKYVISKEPHAVMDTVSLNNAKRLIESVAQPLISIVKLYPKNMQELEEAKKKMEGFDEVVDEGQRTKLIQYEISVEKLVHAITVCTNSTCVRVVKGEMIYYEKPCDPCCRWAPTLWMCHAMKNGYCVPCKNRGYDCSYSDHKWMTTKNVVKSTEEFINFREIKSRVDQYHSEKIQMINASACSAVFLQNHEMFQAKPGSTGKGAESGGNGDICDTLAKEIKSLRCDDMDEDTTIIVQELENFMTEYTKVIESMKKRGKTLSSQEVAAVINDLYKLQIVGPQLENATNLIRSATGDEVKKHTKRLSPKYFVSWFKSLVGYGKDDA